MHFPIDAHLGCFHSGAITNKTVMNIFFFNPVTSELFIDLLPPKRCPASAALAPQNFGVIDLRHQFAVHNPAGGGPLDDCMALLSRMSPRSKSSPSSSRWQ